MRIHRDGSLPHAERWKNSLSGIGHIAKMAQIYSGGVIAGGAKRITSTIHEHVFCPSHDHGSSPVHEQRVHPFALIP
jgi:hypothetical protein